ncbi:DUF397 domain-containing protein [Kitasatospora sp. NPDC015120]|uniref:DUF397 domain-containing protein n=1 Tax=Kitasatospora sp. NPDC015120 TaxID=3364023 RepID=UPI0036F4A5BF
MNYRLRPCRKRLQSSSSGTFDEGLRMGDLLTTATWRASSYSAQEGQCIEVSDSLPGAVPVRDSKDPEGPALVFPANAWRAFVNAVQAGEFGAI